MISVNRVYNTTQFLLEKNARGFLSPMKFNEFANLAQNVIFENVFYDYTKAVRDSNIRKNHSEYANIEKNYREMIDIFSVYSDTTNFTYDSATNLWSYTLADFYRTENLSLCRTSNNIVTKKVDIEEAEKIRLNAMLNSPNRPTLTYPLYEKVGLGYRIYPSVPATDYYPELFFIRKPKDINWTYNLLNDNPIFNPSASDFADCEMHISLYSTLVIRILGYAGLSIREAEIEQVANNEEMKEMQIKS